MSDELLVCRALDSEPDISQLGLAVTHNKLKFVGHYLRTGAHLQRKLHQTGGGGAFSGIDWRGGVRTDVSQRVCRLFSGIFYKFRGKRMFGTAQVTQNEARRRKIVCTLCFVFCVLCLVL